MLLRVTGPGCAGCCVPWTSLAVSHTELLRGSCTGQAAVLAVGEGVFGRWEAVLSCVLGCTAE